MERPRILVAVLNWGLGHATRCIPIIHALIEENFIPVIASDGDALKLLSKEFPQLETLELPSYNISYTKNAALLKLKFLGKLPHFTKTYKEENERIQLVINERNILGIISDNRWGAYSNQVPSVFITHQINVLSGITTYFSSKIQQHLIKKFDECWIPDLPGSENLSGRLGHLNNPPFPIRHIGLLSRFEKRITVIKFDIAVILSGPEPQRSLLEKKIKKELLNTEYKILLVRGVIEKYQVFEQSNNILIYNYLESEELNEVINKSELVICRSGYTSLMDLAKLKKRTIVIPTPGQDEQIYLAKRLHSKKMAFSCTQEKFNIKIVENAFTNQKLIDLPISNDLSGAFSFFERK
jgi:UDP:flavonoid glycosyltransferase YjiC (YdhE family)